MSLETMMTVTPSTQQHSPHFIASPKHVAHFDAYNDSDNDDNTGEAAVVVDYGYGDNISTATATTKTLTTTEPDYGYGHTTTTTTTKQSSTSSLYRTTPVDDDGDNSSDSVDYGYGETTTTTITTPATAPAPTRSIPARSRSSHAMPPRRSSLKCGGSNARRSRRASISYKGEIDVTLPDRSTVRRRVSIGFSNANDVKEVESLTNLAISKEELWVPREQEGINKERAYVVAEYARKLDAATLERKNVYIRGLERQLNPKAVRKCIKTGQWTVLDEQAHQRSQGVWCDETMSSAYREATAVSVAAAQRLAAEDYNVVKEEHEVIRRMMRRASM